jgi:hypothetical protein
MDEPFAVLDALIHEQPYGGRRVIGRGQVPGFVE